MYSVNSKRPHTVIKNILYDLKNNDTYYLISNIKRIVKNVNYFSLQEIDFSILRAFVLKKLSQNKNEIIIETLCVKLDYTYSTMLNDILISKNKKDTIVSFLKYVARHKETAIELQLLERKDDKDLLKILKYCEI